MAAASFYAQINVFSGASFDDVPAGAVGLGSKNDGLYARLPSSIESRLLTVADIGVNVAAYNHSHNYDNYLYWDCKVGLTADHITSSRTVEHYASTGIALQMTNPGQNVTRITHSISDEVVRKTGTPSTYTIPFFYNQNTLQASDDFWYSNTNHVLTINNASASPGVELVSHPSTSSYSGYLLFKRSYLGGNIASGAKIMSLQAEGAYTSGTYRKVGEMKFVADEEFSPGYYGTRFDIDTYTQGEGGTYNTRLRLRGTGLCQINGGLMVGELNDPTSVLVTNGSFAANCLLVSGSLTLDSSHYCVVFYGANGTITLPSASSCPGRIYIIVNRSGYQRTISTYTRITGATSTTIGAYISMMFQSTGSVWQQLFT